MSTRATYEIGGQVFYVHHDGYASGAAAKFADMIGAMTVPANGRGIDAIEDRRGGATFAFIRGNLNAEPTEGHNAHGDTEYRWKIVETDGKIYVESSKRINFDSNRWTAWTTEALEQFINRHYPGAVVAVETGAFDPYWKRTIYATTINAAKIAAEYRQKAATFAEGNPNKPAYEKRALGWASAAADQMPARLKWLEKEALEARDELAKGGSWGRTFHTQRLAEISGELGEIREMLEPIAA